MFLMPEKEYTEKCLLNKTLNSIYYTVEAICRAISPGQYNFWYCPAMARHKYFRNSAIHFHVIKGTKSSVSITTWLLTLGIGRSNARALRAWALPFPSLGLITMLIRTLRVLFLLYLTLPACTVPTLTGGTYGTHGDDCDSACTAGDTILEEGAACCFECAATEIATPDGGEITCMADGDFSEEAPACTG